MGTEMQTVLPVAKSLYLLTVVSCPCVHWQFPAFRLTGMFNFESWEKGVWRFGACRESKNGYNWLYASVCHSPFRWHWWFRRAIRLAPQESTECIFTVWEGDCTQALCCYLTHSCLTHSADVPCAFIECCHLTVCTRALHCYWALLSHREAHLKSVRSFWYKARSKSSSFFNYIAGGDLGIVCSTSYQLILFLLNQAAFSISVF